MHSFYSVLGIISYAKIMERREGGREERKEGGRKEEGKKGKGGQRK